LSLTLLTLLTLLLLLTLLCVCFGWHRIHTPQAARRCGG
jgi:hypothetical protein